MAKESKFKIGDIVVTSPIFNKIHSSWIRAFVQPNKQIVFRVIDLRLDHCKRIVYDLIVIANYNESLNRNIGSKQISWREEWLELETPLHEEDML